MARTLSLNGTKEAALFFDEVLPFDAIIASGPNKHQRFSKYSPDESVPFDSDPRIAHEVLSSLLPRVSDPHKAGLDVLAFQMAAVLSVIGINMLDGLQVEAATESLEYFNKNFGTKLGLQDFLKEKSSPRNSIFVTIDNQVKKMGFGSCSAWGDFSVGNTDATNGETRFESVISGLNLIDTSKLSWAEIIEFRKDNESRKALRDLRLFFAENFSGKDEAYVSDKLMQLVDKQEAVARLWKFETVQKSLAVAFTNQSAIVSSASGLAAVFGGAPLSVVAAASLAFPIGTSVLEFTKVMIQSNKDKIDRPVRFLTKLRSLAK